ncbi:putative senescence regulator S40 [Helianthus annuus]|nr:putative senescence regulator S40 [Helianthus annuus]
MAEEFEESDVVFTMNNVDDDECFLKCFTDSDSDDQSRRSKRKKVEKKTKPVNISWCGYMEPSLYEYEGEEGEMVPPHVLVRRRLAEKMAFSVCYGIGRTLKGRDLSEMRNCVLRMTGFLES